jgi:hypothetical protein
MSKIEAIERQVRQLSPEELSAFREWFTVFDAEVWDRRLETDARAGKLDALAEAALKAHASGTTTKF